MNPKALTHDELNQLRAIIRRTNIKSLLTGCTRIVAEEISECERLNLPAAIRVYQEVNRSINTAIREIVS